MSLAVTAIFALLTVPLMLVSGAAPGGPLREVFTQPILSVVVSVVVLGPLIEEIIFRGWLTGTWRSITGSALFLFIFYGGAVLMTDLVVGPPVVKQLGLAGLGMGALWLIRPLDSGTRVVGYKRVFPFLFWGQGIVFGALHYQNVAADSVVVGFISTLPLIVCAWLWGYARIVLGLGGAVLLHAAYNIPAAVGLIVLMTMQAA